MPAPSYCGLCAHYTDLRIARRGTDPDLVVGVCCVARDREGTGDLWHVSPQERPCEAWAPYDAGDPDCWREG